ncbi:MAG: bifunctional diguanylate cyclase/phosphodiesterase [Tistrella sp.]|uniref:Bifunctional diguanylate cyclase/phosphodiesterase n=1 Tax=Tistrella mobilis TaxID=171437 RepID=A0A3B9IRR5_9PROT|nr:EAL domain-containing protein [Tistrella sp.]MAD40426.1 bifunctional diguanylate cyclase/phosphodiesterase [Tistrella sp.]MBA74015.1 bifunctional diguanylate cyclase/phosphodiesterase [Tistrella sp.]HAE50027.1 bifunctional diguanylate cyclase/phosphodiesterase [Tistrella mobilis]
MKTPSEPTPVLSSEDEADRLSALAEYHLVDTPPEEEFDRLVGLASRLFDVPIVLVSLVAGDRQFFKARLGLDVCETSREVSFCAHAILADDVFVIPDARQDPRFMSNPLVLGQPFIRFYAGKPLVTPAGRRIGTLCLIDTRPRHDFSAADRCNLTDIASLVMERMEIRRLSHARLADQARFENIAATSPDAILCLTGDGRISFWNAAAERLFGYTAAEATGQGVGMLVPENWRTLCQRAVKRLQWRSLPASGRTIELPVADRDGRAIPADISVSTWTEAGTVGIGLIIRDVTGRRSSEERLFRLAYFDPLTGLPNRGAWYHRMTDVLAAGRPVTLMVVDLAGFKEINEAFGTSTGDLVLKSVAARLRAFGREHAPDHMLMVARLGGDEFVLLLAGDAVARAQDLARGAVAALAAPHDPDGRSCTTAARIGLAIGPDHGDAPDDLLAAANLALHQAKTDEHGPVVMFDPAFRTAAARRRALEHELRIAFETGQFDLHYQPLIACDGRKVVGAEALIRWNHPERGLLAPAAFLDVLAQKPSAEAVGDWILRTACRQAAVWRASRPDFRIAVNLFEAQFRSGHLPELVREVLAETGLPPAALELEIVETIALRNDPLTLQLLHNLRALGVGLAFDDYGTGFASLSLLKRFPVTRLKIDRSFVRDITTDAEDAAVVRAVLYLGRSFGMEVIAEGVETEAQLEMLCRHDCHEVQGYLFGRPVPVSVFTESFVTGGVTEAASPPARSRRG